MDERAVEYSIIVTATRARTGATSTRRPHDLSALANDKEDVDRASDGSSPEGDINDSTMRVGVVSPPLTVYLLGPELLDT